MVDGIIKKHRLKDTFAYLDNVTVAGTSKVEHDENVKHFLEVVQEKNLTLNHSKTISSTKSIKVLGFEVEQGLIKPDPDRL